jgi:hypothetical protein
MSEVKPAEDQKPVEKTPEQIAAEKLAQEQAALAEQKIREEAERKVAEEQKAAAIKAEAEALAKTLLEQALTKNAHDQEVERATWKLKSQQEFGAGGEVAFGASLELAQRALKTFDPDGRLQKTLTDKGMMVHPDVLRTFVELGKAISDDKLRIPTNQPPPPPKAQTLEDRLAARA